MPITRPIEPLFILETVMHTLTATLALIALTTVTAPPAIAHGDAPHPACKKGYVVTDDHRCVKQP
jgi:hypothetical protein